MADSPNPEEAEKAFWEKFTGTLDSWFDNKMKTLEDGRSKNPPKGDPPPPGTSRTGGSRTTLSGIIADLVFGPEKD